ncbi:predicted protein [Botrytis cinerea T4]|uniref:Uncharacterized protein n=1 Tax=Botryotinia fuckeliana (strain T4) TaxID=999810 RepID=G2Y3I3_BOTF4|nr:predicted protein [Botrytis cinerea T4]
MIVLLPNQLIDLLSNQRKMDIDVAIAKVKREEHTAVEHSRKVHTYYSRATHDSTMK